MTTAEQLIRGTLKLTAVPNEPTGVRDARIAALAALDAYVADVEVVDETFQRKVDTYRTMRSDLQIGKDALLAIATFVEAQWPPRDPAYQSAVLARKGLASMSGMAPDDD